MILLCRAQNKYIALCIIIRNISKKLSAINNQESEERWNLVIVPPFGVSDEVAKPATQLVGHIRIPPREALG